VESELAAAKVDALNQVTALREIILLTAGRHIRLLAAQIQKVA